MSVVLALVTTIALIDGAAAAAPTDRCVVPESFFRAIASSTNVANAVKARQRLDISVIGTGSSSLPGSTAPALPIRRGSRRRCRSN